MLNSNIVEKYIKYIQNILKEEYIPININEINKELTPEVESILIFTYECISNINYTNVYNHYVKIYHTDPNFEFIYSVLNKYSFLKSIIDNLKILLTQKYFKIVNNNIPETQIKFIEKDKIFNHVLIQGIVILQKILKDIPNLNKQITTTYGNLLSEFVNNHLPIQYEKYLQEICYILYFMFYSADINKILLNLKNYKFKPIKINLLTTGTKMIINNLEIDSNAFVLSLIKKIMPLIKVFKYLCEHPNEVIEYSQIFVTLDDEIF